MAGREQSLPQRRVEGWRNGSGAWWRSPPVEACCAPRQRERPRSDYMALLRTDGGREEKHFSVTHGIRDWPEHYRNPLLHIYKRTFLAPKAKEFRFMLSTDFFFLGKNFKDIFHNHQTENKSFKKSFSISLCPSIANPGRDKIVNGCEEHVGCTSGFVQNELPPAWSRAVSYSAKTTDPASCLESFLNKRHGPSTSLLIAFHKKRAWIQETWVSSPCFLFLNWNSYQLLFFSECELLSTKVC